MSFGSNPLSTLLTQVMKASCIIFSRPLWKSSPKGIKPTPMMATLPLMLMLGLLYQFELVAVEIQPAVIDHSSEHHLDLGADLHLVRVGDLGEQAYIAATSVEINNDVDGRRLQAGWRCPVNAEGVHRARLGELVVLLIETAALVTDLGLRIGYVAAVGALRTQQ